MYPGTTEKEYYKGEVTRADDALIAERAAEAARADREGDGAGMYGAEPEPGEDVPAISDHGSHGSIFNATSPGGSASAGTVHR
jgi:hypothetical protein